MFSKAFVAFAALALATSVVAAPGCTETYTVVDGDTCDAISFAKQIPTYQLSDVNDEINDDCSNIVAGQKLCLGLPGQDCRKVHTVVPNDTCAAIADKAGISLAVLRDNNPQINDDCDNIYIGEVLGLCEDTNNGSSAPASQPTKKPVKNVKPPAGAKPAVTKPSTPTPTPSPPPKDDKDDHDEFAGLPECENEDDDGYYHDDN